MSEMALEFFARPAPMSELPDHPALSSVPTEPHELPSVVQGLVVHRDWVAAYDIPASQVRLDEQQLRSTRELLIRAFELSSAPIAQVRPPIDRVVGICRHFTLLHTALLRSLGVPARVRCGFSNYFDRTKWYDHWITERWNGQRWVRDDPQIDEIQAEVIKVDFDVHDQPPGEFLSGNEAWLATRAGDLDPAAFGIFDMWGQTFIAGNVLLDLACLNKVELLPWDAWGVGLDWSPHDELPGAAAAELDDLCETMASDDFATTRERYLRDDRLRVPNDIVTFVDGEPIAASIEI